eukprot:528284_1
MTTQIVNSSQFKAWMHIPQSFCGRIIYEDTPAFIAGLCSFGFSSCNIVVLTYKTTTNTCKSLIHFDSWNNAECMITDEVQQYQHHYPNGKSHTYIIKRKNECIATEKIETASIFKDKEHTYEIIIPKTEIQGIAIPNNLHVNKQSIMYITDEEYKKITLDLTFTPISSFDLIRHPNEWQLVLERKAIARIHNIKLQNTWTRKIIFNGQLWIDVNRNKDYKKLYKSLQKYLNEFTFDTTLIEIRDSLLQIHNDNRKIAGVKYEPNNPIAIHDYIMHGAVAIKILLGFQKYKDGNLVLTEIVHENCELLIEMFNEHIPKLNLWGKLCSTGASIPKLIKFVNETPKKERVLIIKCCTDAMKIKDIQKINRYEIMGICKNFEPFVHFRMLFGTNFNCYMYERKRKFLQKTCMEFGDIALSNFKTKEFSIAKKLYYRALVWTRFLYCSPSHDIAKIYYNYGASCQNANDTQKAKRWLQVAYAVNEHLPDSKFKEKRKDKLLKRLEKLGVKTELLFNS